MIFLRKGGDAYDCMKTELRSYSMISCNQLIYRGEANEQKTRTVDLPEITSVRNEVFVGRQTPALLPVDQNSGFLDHFGPMRGLFFRGEMKFGPMNVPF